MLGNLYSNAMTAVTSAAELVAGAAETAHIAVKSAANEFTLTQLKAALEGTKEQAWEAPDIWVTIVQVDLKEGLGAQDINIFSLKGLIVKARVEIIGTMRQLTAMMLANSAEKAMGKLGAGEKRGKLVQKIANAKSNVAANAANGSITRSAEFDLNVDLVKTVGVAEVVANVQILDSSSKAIKKYLSNAKFQKYAEEMLSRQMTCALTQFHQEYITFAKARETIHSKAMEIGTVATGYTNSNMIKEKAEEVRTAATEYTNSNLVKSKVTELGSIAAEYANAGIMRGGIK